MLEELVARQQCLTFDILRMDAAIADQRNAVNSQLLAAARQCFGDGGIRRHCVKELCPASAEIIRLSLIDVQPDEIHRRVMMTSGVSRTRLNSAHSAHEVGNRNNSKSLDL